MSPVNRGRMLLAAAIGVLIGLAIARTRKVTSKARMVLNGDWEGQLKAEHRAVRRLLKGMVDTEVEDGPRRAALLAEVADTLTRHAVEEENVIYPALRAAGAGKVVDDLLADHAGMRTLIRRLEGTSLEDPAWAAGARALKDLVHRHMREEERDHFPLLHDTASDEETETLTRLVRHEGGRVG